MNKFQTNIANVNFPHFIYNSSGVYDTTFDQLQTLTDTEYCGAVITKSCTLNEHAGNKLPKYNFTENYSLNSNGLENKGIDYYLQFNSTKKPLIYSVAGFDNNERITILNKITQSNQNLIELNLSCPNIHTDCIARSPETLNNTLQEIFENVTVRCIGLKLPAFYYPSEFKSITHVIKRYPQIKFITSINSIPRGLDININNESVILRNIYGGFGGPNILPIALSNIHQFKNEFNNNGLDIDIIGCGGVKNGSDIFKHVLVGANAVQVGTTLYNDGPECFERLSNEFAEIMNKRGYTTIKQICGKLNVELD